jgi:hypothetical protein
MVLRRQVANEEMDLPSANGRLDPLPGGLGSFLGATDDDDRGTNGG